MRALDWKVIFFAVLGCYVVPYFVLALFGSSLWEGGVAEGWPAFWLTLLFALQLFGLPVLAGYFTARYASNRPQLHVLIIGLVGIAIFGVISQTTWFMRVVHVVGLLGMTALGGFVALRRKPSSET